MDEKRKQKQLLELRKLDKRIKSKTKELDILERQRARMAKKLNFEGVDLDESYQ